MQTAFDESGASAFYGIFYVLNECAWTGWSRTRLFFTDSAQFENKITTWY